MPLLLCPAGLQKKLLKVPGTSSPERVSGFLNYEIFSEIKTLKPLRSKVYQGVPGLKYFSKKLKPLLYKDVPGVPGCARVKSQSYI
jgi:hypothetical protein